MTRRPWKGDGRGWRILGDAVGRGRSGRWLPGVLAATALGVLAPGSAARQVDPAARFTELERRLLEADRVGLDFQVTAEGAASISVEGSLRKSAAGGLEIRAAGEFAGRPVDLLLRTRGETYEFGAAQAPTSAPVPPRLWEAVTLGLTRMGILHNLARLTGNAAPDHAAGGASDWVVVDGFRGADGGMGFDITVSGRPSGSAVLQLDPEGLPAVRRQTVQFPNGEMRVTERYSAVVVEP